jgi:hypothetical protein
MQAVEAESTSRVVTAFVVVVAAGIWLVVAALCWGFHQWNVEKAALRCPAGQELSGGGWGEPDWCTAPGGGEQHPAQRVPDNQFEPVGSAVGHAAVAALALLGAIVAVARTRDLRYRNAAMYLAVATLSWLLVLTR